MKKPYLHFTGSIRFGASFINRMLLLCLLGIVITPPRLFIQQQAIRFNRERLLVE